MALSNNSNLPSIQRIKYEDYKDAPGWFGQFLTSLNIFMTAMYNIVNSGIGYQNVTFIAPFSFQYTPGSTTNFKFANPTNIIPNNVMVGNVYVTGNVASHPSGAVTLFWHYSQGFIFVDSIVGLTNGISYTLSVTVN